MDFASHPVVVVVVVAVVVVAVEAPSFHAGKASFRYFRKIVTALEHFFVNILF